MGISILNWIEIIIALVGIIPASLLFLNYKKTNIKSFIYFAIVFVNLSIIEFILVIRHQIGLNVFIEQISDLITIISFAIFFLHSMRIYWTKTPFYLNFINAGLFFINLLLIIFYKPITISDKEFSIFMIMHRYGTLTNSFGVKVGDNIIQANGFSFILYIYGIFTSFVFLFAYIKSKPVSNSNRVYIVHKIWIFIGLLVSISPIMGIGHLIGIWEGNLVLASLSLLLAILLTVFISLKFPEALLISGSEILRAEKLYKKVINLNNKRDIKEFGMKSLVSYIQSLPIEIISKLKSIS